MVVLGIDPGYAIVGYGAVYTLGVKYKSIGHGAIITDSSMDFPSRLDLIYTKMNEMIRLCNPDAIAIEKLYFQNNQKTAIKVAEARGIILLSSRRANVPIYEYTPLQVKTAVTGYGKAPKKQVMEMTKRFLRLKELPRLDDTADALAVAICHASVAGTNLRNTVNSLKNV